MPRLLSTLALLLPALMATQARALQPPPPHGIEVIPPPAATGEPHGNYAINDSHFHLTNYIQRGVTTERMLEIMGDRVDRVALFGIPLQQKWDLNISGYQPPTYYLHSDARLYYYSFIDAMIADEYQRLNPEQQARFDPMITGFNPTDGYAADHIERVLLMYPGVFAGIGEFSVHFAQVYFDISWDEVAKYVVADEASTAAWTRLLERYPDRFLFGTDSVAPKDQAAYLKTYADYQPLWDALEPETRRLITRGNYERLFDAANARVRRWERAQLDDAVKVPVNAKAAIGLTVE